MQAGTLSSFGRVRVLHVPSESDVGGQQVAHGEHTGHDHHGESQPVRRRTTAAFYSDRKSSVFYNKNNQ